MVEDNNYPHMMLRQEEKLFPLQCMWKIYTDFFTTAYQSYCMCVLNFGPALVLPEMTNEGDVDAYFNENSECNLEVSDKNYIINTVLILKCALVQ